VTSRKTQIEALITKAKEQFLTIKNTYQSSLDQESVSTELKIEIKNMCENLRSALDYLARDINETHCPTTSGKRSRKLYFPITSSREDFKTNMSRSFPGLQTASSELWDYLESIQPYHGKSAIWLSHFNTLNNENKHESLVPQTKSVTEQVSVETQNGKVVYTRSSPHGRVEFGKGVKIMGVPVDPSTQLPVPHPSQKVQRIKWVDFQFEDIPGSALLLLKASLNGVEKITSETRELL